jgi:hypothetical protein
MKKIICVFNLVIMFCLSLSLNAQFVKLEVDEINNQGIVPGKTYRVYAVFETEGDIIDAIYGKQEAPILIQSTKPFYQHPRGGATSQETQRSDISEYPKLKYDSWVTIGMEDNYLNKMNTISVSLDSFEQQGGTIESRSGAWFAFPGATEGGARQTISGPSKRILLMQLTTEGIVTGVINLHGRHKENFDSLGKLIPPTIEIEVMGESFFCD